MLTNFLGFKLLNGVGKVMVTGCDRDLVSVMTGVIFHFFVGSAEHQHSRAVFLHAQQYLGNKPVLAKYSMLLVWFGQWRDSKNGASLEDGVSTKG